MTIHLPARRWWSVAAVIALVVVLMAPTSASGATAPRPATAPLPPAAGYWLVASDGGIFTYGDAGFHGSAGAIPLNRPIVGMAPTPDGGGYWLVASDGGIFTYGDAGFHGSAGAIPLNRPIVGMAPTPDGGGYWLVASDGGIFTYGDAGFHGSAGAIPLNRPIVGMAPTPDGGGYWLVASDGGIFTYGDAGFHGSAGAIPLNRPIVGMAPTPDGGGYWLVASDGGIFTYGDAGFHGSAGAIPLNRPIVGMAPTPDGGGYWLVASDGGIFTYGDAGFHGSAGAIPLNRPIVGMAVTLGLHLGMDPPPGFTSQQLVFADQFSGTTLDPSRWNTYITSRAANGWPWNDNGSGGSGVNPGGFNAEYFQPGQVNVNDGLTLTASRVSTRSGSPWTSGVVSTYGKFQFDGGYVQVEARIPGGHGMWPGFWMLPGPGGTNGDDNEIDLFEGNFTDNGFPPQSNAAWHLITPTTGSTGVGGTTDAHTDLTSVYHVYGLDWVPGQSITWYVDGQPIGAVTSAQTAIPAEPMELILDLMVANATAGGWRTTYDGTTPSPSTLSVAGVQVYS